jgi:hypothetical protein
MDQITINHDNIKIIIEGSSEHFSGQDLYVRAIVTLIEEADTHGWEKYNLEHNISGDALGEFCATLLTTVTRLYASEAGLPEDEQLEMPHLGRMSVPQRKPVHQVLTQIIEYLREGDYLKDEISGGFKANEPEDLN